MPELLVPRGSGRGSGSGGIRGGIGSSSSSTGRGGFIPESTPRPHRGAAAVPAAGERRGGLPATRKVSSFFPSRRGVGGGEGKRMGQEKKNKRK